MQPDSYNKKVLIFAHPRSGSNTLTDVLNTHPSLDLAVEPFNEDHSSWEPGNENYTDSLDGSVKSLENALSKIHKNYNGFKHLFYQLNQKRNEHFLNAGNYQVIFLHRNNLLKAAVSDEVARQTGTWHPENKNDRGLDNLKPLDIERLEAKINTWSRKVKHYRKILQKSNTSYTETVYEDLFTVPEDDRLAKVQSLFSFLDLEVPKEKINDIKELIAPQRKMTDKNKYEMIPNIDAVEESLGCKQTGFLFKN